MKKNIFFLLPIVMLLFAIIGITSCGDNYNISKTIGQKTLIIGGIVTDLQGNPIPNVNVIMGNKVKTTNNNGIFFLSGLSSNETFTIKFRKNGYLPNIRSGKIRKNKMIIQVAMIPDNLTIEKQIMSGTSDSIYDPNTGAEVVFYPQMRYKVVSTGESYQGMINVKMFYANPISSDYSKYVPGGSFLGVKGSHLKKLLPYGGLFVVLTDPNGRKLNIADNSPKGAKVAIPIDNSLSASAPDTVDFWDTDFNKSFCFASSTGSKDQDRYVAAVLHFSYWRAAVGYTQTIKISGTVTDCNGNAVSGVKVFANTIYNDRTDENGHYSIEIPNNGNTYDIPINITDREYPGGYSNYILYNGGNDEITHDIQLACTQTVSGTIKDCNGNLIQAAVVISYQDQQYNDITKTRIANNGHFSIRIPDNIYNATIYITDNNNFIEKNVSLNGSGNNYNEYTLCPAEVSFTINGVVYNNYSAFASTDSSTVYMELTNNDSTGYNVYFYTKNNGATTYNFYQNYPDYESAQNGAYGEVYNNITEHAYIFNTGNITLTEMTTNRISGQINNATAIDSSGTIVNVSGTFSVPLNN